MPRARPCCWPAASARRAVRPYGPARRAQHRHRRQPGLGSPELQWERATEGRSPPAPARPRHARSRPHKRAQAHLEGWGGRGQVPSARQQNCSRHKHQPLASALLPPSWVRPQAQRRGREFRPGARVRFGGRWYGLQPRWVPSRLDRAGGGSIRFFGAPATALFLEAFLALGPSAACRASVLWLPPGPPAQASPASHDSARRGRD